MYLNLYTAASYPGIHSLWLLEHGPYFLLPVNWEQFPASVGSTYCAFSQSSKPAIVSVDASQTPSWPPLPLVTLFSSVRCCYWKDWSTYMLMVVLTWKCCYMHTESASSPRSLLSSIKRCLHIPGHGAPKSTYRMCPDHMRHKHLALGPNFQPCICRQVLLPLSHTIPTPQPSASILIFLWLHWAYSPPQSCIVFPSHCP